MCQKESESQQCGFEQCGGDGVATVEAWDGQKMVRSPICKAHLEVLNEKCSAGFQISTGVVRAEPMTDPSEPTQRYQFYRCDKCKGLQPIGVDICVCGGQFILDAPEPTKERVEGWDFASGPDVTVFQCQSNEPIRVPSDPFSPSVRMGMYELRLSYVGPELDQSGIDWVGEINKLMAQVVKGMLGFHQPSYRGLRAVRPLPHFPPFVVDTGDPLRCICERCKALDR